MMDASEIDADFARLSEAADVPLWFDVKGMQLRVREIVRGIESDPWSSG